MAASWYLATHIQDRGDNTQEVYRMFQRQTAHYHMHGMDNAKSHFFSPALIFLTELATLTYILTKLCANVSLQKT